MQKFFCCLLAAAALLAGSASTAWAQDDADPEVEVTYGGWAATGSTIVWIATGPLLGSLIGDIYRMGIPDPATCKIDPDACRPGFGKHALATGAVVGWLGLAAGSGLLAGWGTRELGFSPTLGWAFPGGFVGMLSTMMIYVATPQWDPGWLRQTVGITLGLGAGVGAGYLSGHIAATRGHAWPEFGFGLGGALVGTILGRLFSTDRAALIFGGVGGLLGAATASAIWGWDAPPSRVDGSNSSAITPVQVVVPF